MLILLLVAAILLLALFVFMELTELAGAMIVVILLSSGGIYMFDPASAWFVFGALALIAAIVIGLVAYRYMGRPSLSQQASDGREVGPLPPLK